MTEGVCTQKLRDFTVQIRNEQDEIVGTGIAVSMDGKIVTCAHVVRAAGVDPYIPDGSKVAVYFPQSRSGEDKKCDAKIVACSSQYDDDMVLLQIVDGRFPLAPDQIAVLGPAEYSEGNSFRTYGYSPIGNYLAIYTDGKILGSIEPPTGRNCEWTRWNCNLAILPLA